MVTYVLKFYSRFDFEIYRLLYRFVEVLAIGLIGTAVDAKVYRYMRTESLFSLCLSVAHCYASYLL